VVGGLRKSDRDYWATVLVRRLALRMGVTPAEKATRRGFRKFIGLT
jgi:hypothetical protein